MTTPTTRPAVVAGTAHLFALADEATSRALLAEAWHAGVRRFDTAPSYGGGRTEAELGAFLRGRDGLDLVATKVGLAPAMGTRGGGRQLARVARAVLPAAVTGRLRRASQQRTTGRFDPAAVEESLGRSLRRLGGRIDRYLLHEIRPEEITPALVAVLRRAVAAGDIGAAGVATQNELTVPALDRGAGVLTVAQFAVGPLDPPVPLPAEVTTRVGHGLLGAGGRQLAAVRSVAEAPAPGPGEQWRAAVEGTGFDGPDGVARALLGRRPAGVSEVLLATTRPGRTADGVAAVAAAVPTQITSALDTLVAAAGASWGR